jgi:hypothetical protein
VESIIRRGKEEKNMNLPKMLRQNLSTVLVKRKERPCSRGSERVNIGILS